MTASFVTIEEIREFIGIPDGDADYDNNLKVIALAVTEAIETFTRRSFVKQARIEYFDTRRVAVNCGSFFINNAPNQCWLKARPVDTSAAFTVYYDPARVFGSEAEVEEVTNGYSNWDLDAERGILHLSIDTSLARRSVKVAYTGGYSVATGGGLLFDHMSDTAPFDLKQAALIQIAHVFDLNRTSGFNVKSETDDDGGGRDYQTIGGLTNAAKGHLAKYVLSRVGRF